MIQFYSPDIATTGTLGESDSGHAVRVLRLSVGDTISVVDGKGHRYECEITEAHHKHARVKIIGEEELLPTWRGRITLAVAPTKNMDRMEWLLEKAVEIGIDRFVPLLCRRSERKVVKTDRLEKIMVSAMKQSLKGVLPCLDELTPIERFAKGDSSALKYFGYCADGVERRVFADEYVGSDRDVTILIGPEGDFSPEEVEMLMGTGYLPVTFGDNRLRTETAALYALAGVHIIKDRTKAKKE